MIFIERLQKAMAHAGVASRRKSEEMIKAGRVRVNDELITELGFKVTDRDVIEVDGVKIIEEDLVYFLLNKPEATISAVTDQFNRKTVVDLIDVPERIYPVGRLDYDTTGALILTNDGEFANQMMHPRHEMKKTYVAKVKGLLKEDSLEELERGLVIDGEWTAPAAARLLKQDKGRKTSVVELIIHEGRYHQVKKMFETVGHNVIELHRSHFSFLDVKGLNKGEYRKISSSDIKKLIEEANT